MFTKLNLKCNNCDNIWKTNTITSLSTGTGCPKCAYISTGHRFSKTDEEMIETFKVTGKYSNDVKFWKSARETNGKGCRHWYSTCPICSNDDFVKSGVCSGVFETQASCLQRGSKPCRCGPTYKWSKEEREFQVEQKLKSLESKAKFLGWVNYKGFDSNILFDCPTHGNWIGRLDTLLYMGAGCPDCSKSGYDSSKQGYLYVLQVQGTTCDFTGYGISNNFERRLKDHNRNLKDFNFVIMDKIVLESNGKDIMKIEQLIKDKFPRYPKKLKDSKQKQHSHIYTMT